MTAESFGLYGKLKWLCHRKIEKGQDNDSEPGWVQVEGGKYNLLRV